VDTARYTLADCPRLGGAERAALVESVGGDISLPTIVDRMLDRETLWKMASDFYERVMLAKEETGRRREAIAAASVVATDALAREWRPRTECAVTLTTGGGGD